MHKLLTGSVQGHTRICGEEGENSYGSTKDELKVDLSGRILASGTGLPLKWSGDSGQQLYAISKHRGLRRTDRAVTTCGLPHRPWDIRQMKVTLSPDTLAMLLVTTAV